MNIYITSETQKKLNSLISNIKNFFVLDVQQFISQYNLDLNRPSSIYFLNCEIISQFQQAAKLKKYSGIIYINKNINETLFSALKMRVKEINNIEKLILIDNSIVPKHQDLYSLFEEVYFYNRFQKNKIVECSTVSKKDKVNKDKNNDD